MYFFFIVLILSNSNFVFTIKYRSFNIATFCSWVCISVWVKEYADIETYLFYPVKSFLQNQRYRYNGCMLQHACYDKPSKLDYKASELLGAITGSGKAFPIELLEIFNQ